MILADSGFWIALGNRRDRHHAKALAAAKHWSGEGFVTTWPVLTEVTHLLTARVGVHQALEFIDAIAQGAAHVPTAPDDALTRAAYLMRRYRDLPMDLADASLLILAEQLEEGRILSTDMRDFAGYRWKNTRPFINVLLYG
ncbi:pilus biogenesis protein [Betaproteobacteria bacterium]|nr:pilus biogenesis protein [Betaproteobacteria bacterium]GHU01244.1 pilus biogenesis protein [Betaproteobacteria bacterium]GHU12389.1 pilus biogenesis protein [Betaproteobacteria bacterium]GHU17203.1 pilus biogenesis protein [Betaproteobacteria bacterium]GHU23701.1 pilus biogenesis protein [Betaproteobacteria bacterium]